jgi:hypothetical protein
VDQRTADQGPVDEATVDQPTTVDVDQRTCGPTRAPWTRPPWTWTSGRWTVDVDQRPAAAPSPLTWAIFRWTKKRGPAATAWTRDRAAAVNQQVVDQRPWTNGPRTKRRWTRSRGPNGPVDHEPVDQQAVDQETGVAAFQLSAGLPDCLLGGMVKPTRRARCSRGRVG